MIGDRLDRPREACGVFGVFGPGCTGLIERVYRGLSALQHRGQESAGVVAWDGAEFQVHKAQGLVASVLSRGTRANLSGHLILGHTRYSTAGDSDLLHAQPFVRRSERGFLGLAHNGNLVNAAALRGAFPDNMQPLESTSDSEVIAAFLSERYAAGMPLDEAILAFMADARGAFSIGVATSDGLWGARDPHGLRPLCIGHFEGPSGNCWALSSESGALLAAGARFTQELRPGEIVHLGADGIRSWQGPTAEQTFCAFEHVYFARSDARFKGLTVAKVRRECGRRLAQGDNDNIADVVVAVPASALAAALGYAEASGLPAVEGLVRNSSERTFIGPDAKQRAKRVYQKFNVVTSEVAGKRVLLVDDSIVRGNTCRHVVGLLREHGAAEVHVRVASPPVRFPCFMGVDMAPDDSFVARGLNEEQIARALGADSLRFLTVTELEESMGDTSKCTHCLACFTGIYPSQVAESLPGHTPDGRRAQDIKPTIVF